MHSSWHKIALSGCYYSESAAGTDFRGSGRQVLDSRSLLDLGIEFRPQEAVVVTSLPKVLRGMHGQRSPHAHGKLVTCLSGAVHDVLWDARVESATFGQTFVATLSAINGARLYVAPGVLHGFCVLGEEAATVLIQASSPHVAESSIGIHWQSFGHSWPLTDPILSQRDAALPSLELYLKSLL